MPSNDIVFLAAGTQIEYNRRVYTLDEHSINAFDNRTIALVNGPTGIYQPLCIWIIDGKVARAATKTGPWAPAKIVGNVPELPDPSTLYTRIACPSTVCGAIAGQPCHPGRPDSSHIKRVQAWNSSEEAKRLTAVYLADAAISDGWAIGSR